MLYDSRLTQVENKGGKIARKTAYGVKKWVQQESEKQMLLVRLLILAGILGQPGQIRLVRVSYVLHRVKE